MKIPFIQKSFKLCNILKIGDNAKIYTKRNSQGINVYEVTPLRIVETPNEYLEILYNKCMSCVQSVDSKMQILVLNTQLNMEDKIQKYIKAKKKSTSEIEKDLITEYIQKLENVNSLTKTHRTFYILSYLEEEKMQIIFEGMKDYGIKINKVCDRTHVINIVKSCTLCGGSVINE